MSGTANGAFWSPTCCLDGETRTNDSGFARRKMKDSTLYWDPRNMTDAKSTPKTRANSLYCQFSHIRKGTGGSRVLGNDLGSINNFNIHDHTLEAILEHSMSMFESLALP